MRIARLHFPLLLILALPTVALADDGRVDVPAGRLGAALVTLGEQAGISIGLSDGVLAQRPVKGVRGRMSAQVALARLLKGSGARAERIDGLSYRIVRENVAVRPNTAPVVVAAGGEDIVVVASKRGTPLMQYPGAATIVDGGSLDGATPPDSDALTRRVASLGSTHVGPGRNKLFIRGIADSSFSGPTQATVGQYLGDVRLNYNAPDPDLRLYDIERIEVLEGPQGTLYGAGSLGGIIRTVRRAPQLDRMEASASAGIATTAHGDASADLAGLLNVPLVPDALGLRVAGYRAIDGGYIDDTRRGLDDVNRVTTTGARAALRAAPGADWTIDLGGTWQSIRGDDSQYADRDGPPLTRSSALAQDYRNDFLLGDIAVTKRWGDLQWVSAAGIVEQDLDERYDATQPNGKPAAFTQGNRISLVSIENRLSRALPDGGGWLIGGSYLHSSNRLTRRFGEIGRPAARTGVRNRVDEATIYGEASIALTDGLVATGGARVTYSRFAGQALDVAPALRQALAATFATAQGTREQTILLPSLALAATPIDGLVLFARYQQGFRPGGLAVRDNIVERYRGDRMATFETGVRHGLPGRDAFDIAATLAYTSWRNVQADLVDSQGLPTTANVGDGRIYALDLKAGWRPAPGLAVEAGIFLNDSRLDVETIPAIAPGLAGDAMLLLAGGRVIDGALLAAKGTASLPNIAKVGARGAVEYRTMLGDGLALGLSASARYFGSSRLGVGPMLGERQGDYLDAALAARLARGGWTLALDVTNPFDTLGNRFALGTPFTLVGTPQVTPQRPRTIRLGIERRF